MPAPLVGISFAFKLGSATIGTFILATAGWVVALVGQEQTGLNSGTLIPAAALTATAGALGYVVKLVASGALVHRDPAESAEKLQDALNRTQDLAAAALEREQILNQILIARIAKDEAGK